VSSPVATSLGEAGAAARSMAMPAPLRKLIRLLLGLVVAAVIWEGAVQLFGIRPYYLPRLSTILMAIAATPRAYVDGFLRTLAETLIGFASGGAFGVLMGVVFFRVRALREMVFPIFVVSQTIPVIAFGALVVLWFGNTLLAKAIIAFYLTFFPVTVNTLLGLETVDPKQVALMRSFGEAVTAQNRCIRLITSNPIIRRKPRNNIGSRRMSLLGSRKSQPTYARRIRGANARRNWPATGVTA